MPPLYYDKYLRAVVKLQELMLLEGETAFILEKIASTLGKLVNPTAVMVFENLSPAIVLRFRGDWQPIEPKKDYFATCPMIEAAVKEWAKALKGGVFVAAKSSELKYPDNVLLAHGLQYFYLIPINVREKLQYIVTLFYEDNSKISTVETDFFHTIANYLSVFINRKNTESQLFSYKKIFQESNLGIFVINKHGYHIETNYYYRRLVGYDTDEELQQTTPIVLLASKYNAWFKELRKKGYHKQDFDLQHLGIVVSLSSYVIYDTEGEVATYVNLAYDITQLVASEREMKNLLERHQRINRELEQNRKELLKREEQLKMLAENSFEMVTLSDVEGQILYVSPSAEKITGYTQNELYSKRVEVFFEKGDLIDIRTQVQAVLLHKAKEISVIHPFTTKKNTVIWLESFIKPIVDAETQVITLQTSSRDITERVLANKALEESESKFKNLFNKTHDAIFIYHPISNQLCPITEVNEVACKLLGYERKKLLGKNIADFIEDEKQVIKQVVLQDGQNNFLQTFLYNARRERIPVEIVFTLLYEQQGIQIQAIVRDMRERIQAAESQKAQELAERLLKIKTEFLANVSHEIRTPMNGIVGMTHILAQTHLDEKQAHYVRTVQKSAENLLLILNDILDLSKLEAGKMSLKFTTFNLKNTFQQLCDLFSTIIVQKNLQIQLQYTPQTPTYVVADESRLMQVMTNLLSNAVKFTDKGSITIKVEVILYTFSGALLKVMVNDTGVGIATEYLAELFDKFFQIDTSTSKQQGTGLGLSICKQLVSLWQGEIGVETQQGHGSCFWFTLPVQIAKQATTQLPDTNKKTEYLSFENLKILLVEDIVVNQEVAKIMLEQMKITVEVAQNGLEAVRMVNANSYDMILMDIMMPIMNGIEATQHIKKLLPTTIIIGLSANAMPEDAQKYIDWGMNDYLAKPIEPQSLQEKIVKWLPQHIHATHNTPLSYDTPNLLNDNVIQKLQQLTKGNPKKLQLIVQSFEQDVTQLLGELHSAVQHSHLEQVNQVLHTLKGLTATIGATDLHTYIAEWYRVAQDGELRPILEKWEAMQQSFMLTQQQLNAAFC